MQSNTLLSSSIQYGIVSRSIPLTGKVIKGFLSPSPSGNGLGIGNLNTEFAPNVTACALTSDGGTAKIVWGFRSGEIAVMTAAKTMELGTRSAGRLIRCTVHDEHEAEVTKVEWDDTGSYVVSAAKDGQIKVWDAKKVRCVWTSHYFLPDSCLSLVVRSGPQGYMVVSTMDSGEIWIWFRITLTAEDTISSSLTSRSPSVKIPSPVRDSDTSHTPTLLHVDNTSSSSGVHAFVTYHSRPEIWGIFLEYTSSTYRVSKYYSDETSGAVTALLPCICDENSSDERGFVIAGHQWGWITVYPQTRLSASINTNEVPLVPPTRKFEAHPDGSAVTALAWNNIVLVTGSDLGDTFIFDVCSFSRLRVLNSPLSPTNIRSISVGAEGQAVPGGVNQMVLGKDKDFLVVSVGDRALAFKADASSRYGKKSNKVVGKKKAISSVKGYEKILVDQLITESLEEHNKESQYLRKVYGREREHRANLDRLGLDEAEALEYVLMLSRDEALEEVRVGESATQHPSVVDEGVLKGDFDDIGSEVPSFSHISTSSINHTHDSTRLFPQTASSPSLHLSGTLQTPKSKAIPIGSVPDPNLSNRKIQISPRKRKEPRKAGLADDYLSSSIASSISSSFRNTDTGLGTDDDAFPAISLSRSIHGTLSPPRSSPSPPSSSVGSKAKGAWTKPLTSSSNSSPWSRNSLPIVNPNAQMQVSAYSSSARDQGIDGDWADDIDEDTKLAIQLSLMSAEVEARRRGE
ncbi:WD40-repeat-containing domain protein [Lentinula aciculospora]|uniref:WD40-repeat-containing domain protein n=1 Tax=Lentinula aciculospora TaxID=153920 RepID=A0A9W9AEJ1_9AGAR|nr:WD40-repeat-containing domain protein [Lentinula aciculospora]